MTTTTATKQQKDLTIPKFHRRVMVFDTETSGLIPKHKFGTPFPPMEEYPYIMQFSWIIYNVSANLVEEVVDEYVRIPDAAPINPESMKVHGITREVAKEKGKPIIPLLTKFFAAYMKCDCIIAHNLRFDGEMVRKEMWRNRKDLERFVNKERVNMMCGVFAQKFNASYHIDTFCTMMNTIQFCGIDFAVKSKDVQALEPKDVQALEPKDVQATENLGEIKNTVEPREDELSTEPNIENDIIPEKKENPTKSPTTNTRKKFPRLDELYGKLFETPLPMDMHNSIVDVLVCLRCFLKVRGAKEMTEEEFLGLIQKHSRG